MRQETPNKNMPKHAFFPHRRRRRARQGSCHDAPQQYADGLPLVAIVGCPNVGKSVLFNLLTGAYVTVSNYPGTTVEVSRGRSRMSRKPYGVVDTPGMYQLMPLTEEERVARHILLYEHPNLVLHVIDAKNVERMLPMTLQLLEAGLPLILVVNLMDEAEKLGVEIDVDQLSARLGIPVAATTLTRHRGIGHLKELIEAHLEDERQAIPVETCIRYPAPIESAAQEIRERLQGNYQLSPRAVSLLVLENDAEVAQMVATQEAGGWQDIQHIARVTQERYHQPLPFLVARQVRIEAENIIQPSVLFPHGRPNNLSSKLSELTINPWTGIPILLVILVLLYLFVGVLGAQTLVGWIENGLFANLVNPWVDHLLATTIPWQPLRDLIGGDYGLITLGLRYAFAIIFHIVGTFFLAFSMLEDSGYLPRLAMLIDRVFKRIGLNGRAVIPMVLGFGCDTMATIVTRTLETRRERVLATLLLALAIPCSAQLGVMLGLLSGSAAMLLIWSAVVGGVFLLVGLLAAKLMPGERPAFYMELPPLRLPNLGNSLVKTTSRMEWYFREVLPVFLLASVLIWLGKLSGAFDLALNAMLPLMHWLGLPDQAAVAFLFGFFRRDYGAAGLYDLRNAMTNAQLIVSTVTLTLFIPCIAQFAVMVKERGWKTTLGMVAFILPFAFLVGGALNWIFKLLGMA
jgi:ferrous iron transport protein B